MRTFFLVLMMLSVTSVFGSELTIDSKKVTADKLEKKMLISYGDKENEVGIHIAQNRDEQSFGVSSFLVDNGNIYVIDSVNGMLKSAKTSDLKLSPVMKIEPQTIDIMKDSENIYLYNFHSHEFSKIADQKSVSVLTRKITSPLFRLVTDLKKDLMRKIDDKVTVTKKSMEKAVVSVSGKKHSFNVKNTRLGSLQFISEDISGNLHFILETLQSMNPVKVERYWLKTDNNLNLLSITALPISDIFLPFREIQINSDGSIWFINPAQNGLEILYGKGRAK